MIRTWRPGDWFCLLGLGKRKKLQDYFVDRKIPRLMRDRVPLLISGDSILWVGGHDVDDRFKVTEKTQEILHLRIAEA